MSTDNKRKLYDALSQDYDMGSYEQFCTDIQDDAKRRKLYDATSEEYDYGDYDKFSNQLGFGAAPQAGQNAMSKPEGGALPGMVSRETDAPYEIARHDEIADAISENERLQKDEMAKKAADIDENRGWDNSKGVWDNFVRIVGGGANEAVGNAAPNVNVGEHEETMRNLVAEHQVLEETKKRRDAGMLKKSDGVLNGMFDIKNNARNIAKGVKDVVTDSDFYLNGVIGMQKGEQLIKIEDKIGRGEELTDSELRLVNAAVLQGRVESETTVPHGYTAGQTTAEMMPFMAQMAMNPANGAASTMAKAAAKQSVKRFGKKAARRIAAGVTVAGEVGESAVLANTLQAPSTASDIKSRYIGKAYVDENGQIAFDGSKDWSDAIYRGEGAAIIENYTELLGSHFGLMKDGAGELVKTGVTKLGGGKLVNQVSDLVTRIGSTKWAQAIGNIEKRANWNGSIGEMLEEEAGIVLNSMFVGDNKISDLVDPEQQIDIALGVGLFGGFVSGIKTAGYPVARYNARRNLNRADVRASELMGDKWDGLRNSIDDAEEGDLSSIVASVIAEEGMTGQKQRAVVDYARALMTSRGYNISSESVREDGMASAEEVGAVDSFDAGYSITDSQEMVDARLEMERQRMKLVSSMSEDIADEFDADPLDALARTYDPEIREIASKYVNAKMVYDGMIQRVRDDIDGRIAQSDAMIDGRVNRDTGMIQGATLTDGKEVYVVNGNVAMLDDGVNVDVENSDESLIVRDAEGRLEFVAPSQVQSLLAPVDAASEKEAAAEAIRNEIAQSAADKIDGVLHFAPNDVYAVINEDGTQESLTIVGESVDASGVAVDGMVDVMREDGSVVAMNTADIQRMVDESNARRLDERDKARESAEADSGVEAAGAAAEEPRPSALSRIPTDQNGEPLYEQVDADTAWDAFVEQSEGDEEIAREVVADILAEKRKALADAEKALKSIGDSKPNASNGEGAITIQERIAAKMASKRALTDARDAVERAKGVVEHWQSIGDTMKRRAEAEAAERRRQAEIAAEEARQAAERERADAEEAERLKREALNGVPDWGYDTAAHARARGYRRNGVDRVERQSPISAEKGREVEVKFSDGEMPKGRIAIIDAGQLQPSHIQGARNPSYFLDEAQPKERNDAASVVSAQKIASNIRPEEITSSVTAYTGAPTVNARGETIQGNNRSDALKLMWESHPESAARYKQYLIEHAEELGLTPEQIESVENPVLVNMVDVDDNEAIRLGQFVAQDIESGGIERIKPKNAVTRMGSDIRGFAEMLLRSADDDASFSQLVAANGADALAWMSQRGYISPTQYNSALDSKGNLTGEAANDLKGILYQSIFQGGSTRLEEMFNNLPAKAQKAILATAYRDHDSNVADRMTGEIQQSILAFNEISSFPGFAEATNLKDAMAVVEAWKSQYVMDDVTGDSYLPTEKFSNFALHLVAMYRGGSQRFIQGTLNNLFDVVQGVKEDTLFEESDKVPKSLAEAIRIVLDLDYQPINNKKNGYNGSNAVGVDTPQGEEGGRGSAGDAPNGEREPGNQEPTDGGGGTEGDSGGRGNLGRGGAIQATAPQAESRGEKALTREEATALIADMEENAVADPNISLSPESWQQSFGLNNSIDTPLGKVKMGEGQYAKLVEKKRSAEFGMVVQTLKDPDVILIEPSTAKDGQITQRDYSYVFVKTFIRDGRKVKYYTSVSVLKDGLEVSVSSHIANKTSILKKLESMERAYTKESLLPNSSEWHLAEHPTDVPDLLPTQGKSETNEEVYNRHTTAKQPAEAVEESPNPAQSDTQELASMNSPTLLEGKVSENFTDKQAGSEKSSYEDFTAEEAGTIGEQIAAAEAEVNTQPTEGQKVAGNYKKGHVQVGAFDVTIENPKGSKRSGTDADGKKWETTMTHTYGYIKGTEGVDGDHIDVFLSSDIDGWDGRRVYVVDQYNPDGTFDEHKVMLGFNDRDEAFEAYLSNYEAGWEKGRRLDVGEVDIREFEKWVDSSRRKTKAFSEYRSVNAHPKYDRTVPTTPEAQLSAISRIIGFAKSVKNRVERAVIGGITKRQAKDFADNGIEVDESWVHSFESSAVSHNQKHHGNEKIEAERGQIAITEDDYSRIPEILEDYDKVSKSPNKTKGTENEVIIYEKGFGDGYVYYLEEKRDNRKSLAFHTMYKKKKGTDSSDGFAVSTAPITPKATPDNLSSNSDSKDNALSANNQINMEQSGISTDATKVAEPGQNTAGATDGGYTIDANAVTGMNDSQLSDEAPLSLDDMRSAVKPTSEETNATKEEISSSSEETPAASKPKNPSGNKLVTDEQYAELLAKMRKKMGGQLNMGVDPEILAIGSMMAVYHIEKGARKFTEYVKAMVADLGEKFPARYLKGFYKAAHEMIEDAAPEIAAEMDADGVVNSADIASIINDRVDAMATAAMVVEEEAAEGEREDAERKLKEERKAERTKAKMSKIGIFTNATKVAEPGQNTVGANVIAEDEEKPRGKKSGKAKRKAAVTDGGLFDSVDIPAIAKPAQRSESELEGDSAVYQKREMQTVELVEEIGGVIESRVMMLQLDAESVKPLTMTDVKKMASKYDALEDISDTDLQELVELAMTQLTRSEALINIDGTAEQQRSAYDHIVNLYRIQPSLNARDSERLIKQQYSTPTPFGYVMGQFVRAGGKPVGSMLEPSAGNGALTITVHPSLVHVNDIDDARLANLRKLNYGNVTAQDALLPFGGDKVDVVMTNPPFGTVAEKVYNGVFKVSSLEGQMAINALEKMKDDGRAAIIIGGNTSYRTNGSMNPKDAAFFGYLYSNYNVADVINISGKALYSRSGTGYDVRMILIDGRKSGEFKRVYPPVKAKARAEQVTTFDELYKRIQNDIQQIQQMGNTPADVQREPGRAVDGKSSAHVRIGNDSQDTGSGRRPDKAGDVLGGTRGTDIAEPAPGDDGRRPAGVGNAERGDGTGVNDVQRTAVDGPGRGELDKGVGDGRGRSGNDESVAASSRPDGNRQRLAVKTALGDEKVAYPNQSDNGFTLMSVVPATQARVLQKSLGEVGDVDQYLVDELGYSSKDELYSYLAAEQIDSVALAIHQMNKGNAFIIGDMTGVGKGRQGAALIRYAVKHGKTPIYFTQKPTLFTDNYRDLVDIGSSNLRPFIMASVDSERSGDIVDAEGNVVYKIPSKKEKERVYKHIMEHGTLPDGYDYVLSTYSQIQNGVSDYRQNEDGTWSIENRKLPKKSKGYTPADHNGQMRRDALARLAEGNITILDESHTVGGDSGCGRYMQMLTSQAEGVTFLSATFAKRADNMPIYAQRTAIAEAGVKASELIAAIAKGGVTLQEIMSKQLVESGQMIRRERSFEGVTIDWLGVEEETDRRQREQFNEVAYIFNAIRNFQDDYITPIIEAKNEAAAEVGATVGHRQGAKDLGVKNVPFASKMYNLVNQLLFALKVDAVADRVIDNLRNGYKPVISFTNTMEGFLSSAPKGEAMDEIPNFSITLMRALDGVMRFTENDADNNSDGGSISLNELSTEGRNAYNAIREKIMNLSADLPISPMDAIRMKIEDAGYSVAEITGREMQLNRNDAGRYVVEPRKDRDKKAAMRDFNSGKLDVLMINKSGSTGISLHASSKFDDQRQRVMVFAQFQSDINDEVQMRGRIDRSGQVTRGRYEYIMSTIPAEQRIQMMFKAKLKSLDANTTSSQKSKFNEIEIVDYLNKYGDEVVWEYMKEHPELEERLGDPLEMLHDGNDDGGPRVSEKEDTSKKPGCAGKVSRYLAFLSVEEQDEIFREITEAYRVKIQLLDDAGENDLEITTMPLRADTHKKQIWHEGENPGSGNAFADNTYVEEVEVDVLKKPMKRSEIAAATRKLAGNLYAERNGVMDWEHYAYNKGEEIHQFYQTKADEAFGKMKEAGENRIAKAREKAVVAATKARGRGENNFTDAEIQSLADTVANEEREKEEQKQNKRHNEIMAVNNRIQALLNRLRAEKIYVVPQDLKVTAEMFSQTFGTFVGFKFNNGYTLGSSTAIFATLDGRRKVELALSDPAIDNIISATEIAYRYSPKDIGAISMDNWDGKVPTQSRQKRYIITGNLLQALVDTEKGDRTRGNLISFSTIDGETRQGILMGENFKPADLRSSASLSSRLNQIRDGKVVVSENGDVVIERVMSGWKHKGDYEIRVPKSKQRGGIYTMHPELLELVEDGNFTTKGNSMVAYLTDKNIAKAVDMLSRAPFNLTVLEESRLSDVSEAEDVRYRIREDEPPTKTGIGYKVFVLKDGKLYPPMVANPNGEATPVGVWLDADAAPIAGLSKTGRQQVKAGGKGTQGGSGKLAYRPGWHLGVIPYALQFNRKDESTGERELFPKNFVWAEVEYADDVDYQEEAMSYGYNSNGKFQHSYAGLPRLPLNGSYKYRTNPNPETDPWIITGAMKVNRLLTPTEVDSMVEAAGREPQRRQEGAVTDADIERLNDELTAERERSGDGSYSDAEVSMENDPWSKAWGETLRSKREQRAFAKRERERMRAKAVELSERLGVDIEIIEDNSSLEGKRGRSKGWYSVKDGKISAVLGNHVSVADIEKTVLHEAVAHHGLRELLGEHFDEFLDKVYELADNSIKERIALLASRNGWNRRVATEEYLAGLAEDTDFENAKAYNGWWGKIKRLFLDMLSAVGFKHIGVELSDNELRYILWRSYKNMVEPGRFRVFEWEAEDVAMKYNLKAGEYAESSPVTEQRVAEAGEVYELNDRFNNELNRQIAGDLPQGHVYDMGMPSEYLLSTGIAKLPIRLSAKILNAKSNLERHAYKLETLRNLVYAIQKPWAIFSYGDRSMAQNMIIGIEDNGRQFLVGISINPTIKGRVLEINSIRNVFPKNNHEWVNWINEGKLLRVDGKKEIQDIIAKLRMNPVAFDYVDLDNAAKIVENFKNPTIREQNNNAGESVDDGVRYRMGDFTPRDRKIAADVYDKMVSSARFEFSEAMQDSMLGLKKLYEAIKGKKGFRIEEVEGYENAYIYENRMSSTNGNEQHLYFIRKMKPLLKAISDICGNSGSERRILTDYMIAKHGLERNVILAERDAREAASKGADYNDELAKCRQRDYSGLTALTGEKDLATAERVAQQMVDDYERDTDTTELWSRVKSATEATLEKMYTSGLMSEERFNQVRGMFQHYIPLRGWDETTSNEVYTYLLQDDHATGTSLTKKAGGRSSKADDPIANIAAMADSAISQGNRNIMKQRFLNFVLNNPSDLVSHNELWLEHDAVNDEWRPVFAELDAADTPADVAKKIEAFEARMKSLQAQHPDKYKRGSEAVNIPYKVIGNNLREHQVLVRRNGVTTVLTINGNPRAAQALNGLTNPDVKAGSHYDEALSVVMYVNRQLSALYTTRNPDFVVSNFMRDMLYSNCMTWIKETPSYALRYHRNFGKLNPAVMTRLLNKYENGTLNSNDYIEHAFEQFMANGGETGFTNLKDIEGHKRAIAKELRRQGNVALRSWNALGMKLDLMNRSVENCARFAAYVTSREMGRSVDRSIYDAKEISVNFNKKGSSGTMAQKNRTLLGKIGAHTSGWGRLLYVFWNAGIQGMTNYGRAAKRNPAKATAAATALFSLGWVIPLLAQAGGGDDDDKNAYYNLPEYVRRSNVCFKAGEQWITIPLPIEYRAIYGMGELACGVISGNERYSDEELAHQMMAQVSQLLPIDMLEGGGGLSPLIPSAAKPVTEAYLLNRGWTGLPVYKDTSYNKRKPEWTKAYSSTDQHLVDFAKWLNETTGGDDDFKKGKIDINPARIEYVLNGTFGGLVSFPSKIVKTAETISGKREFEWRNIPLANRVVKSGDERTANRKLQNEYYKYKDEAEDTKRLYREYDSRAADGIMGYAQKADFLYNSKEYLRYEIFESYEPELESYRKEISEEINPEVKSLLEAEMYSTMREMVDALHGVDE